MLTVNSSNKTIREHEGELYDIDMLSSLFARGIYEGKSYDVHYNPSVKTDKGWKLSIQGNKLDDIKYIMGRLFRYLVIMEVPFKVGTIKRLACQDKQQARKILTIYVPDSMNYMDLAEKIYLNIIQYKGWYDIKTPDSYQHYAGGVFFRNDRDENGNYITAH